MAHDIKSQGYSATTFAVAQALSRNGTFRRAVKVLLDAMEKPQSYSNQEFDQQQHLATLLADAVRAMEEKNRTPICDAPGCHEPRSYAVTFCRRHLREEYSRYLSA